MITVKAKVTHIIDYGSCKEVYLMPVWDSDIDSPNHKWSVATPDGLIRLKITNPAAFNQFVVHQIMMIELKPEAIVN